MMDLRDKIRVRTITGELITLDQWQKLYGIEGDNIGRYFSYKEPVFMRDLQDYGELEVNAPLIGFLDAYREVKQSPVNINSFNRSKLKQRQLADQGYKAATFSPHVVKLAADVDTYTAAETIKDVSTLKNLAKDLNIGVRIGFKQYLKYGQTFIHIDVCPMYYRKDAVWHNNKHPEVWEKAITW